MESNSPLDQFLKDQDVVILDGGLATELENHGHNLNHHLWSARLLINNPGAIHTAHLSYLVAGADCIISASYQATLPGFISEGISKKEAKDLIKSTITIACDARDDFLSRYHNNKQRIEPIVAASIGPYGAYLANGSEYTGIYDVNSEDLKRFHESRWEILAHTSADLFACESIPCIQEAEVIRHLLENTPDIQAWICFTCRDDRHLSDGSLIEDALAIFEDSTNTVAIGINCTAPKYILSLINKIALRVPSKNIVVYPNSGEVFNIGEKTWSGDNTIFDLSKKALEWNHAGARLIGGCCRTGPEYISNLRQILLKNTTIK